MPMIAITTSISTSVKPREAGRDWEKARLVMAVLAR
jgi:hypothetical protein